MTEPQFVACSGSPIICTTSPIGIWKAWRRVVEVGWSNNPKLDVCFRYRRIHFTVCQWSLAGECINWHTAKEMSGLVSVRYWSEPTTIWYSVGSAIGVPLERVRLVVIDIGVQTGLDCNIPDSKVINPIYTSFGRAASVWLSMRLNTQEIMESAKIFYCKLTAKREDKLTDVGRRVVRDENIIYINQSTDNKTIVPINE